MNNFIVNKHQYLKNMLKQIKQQKVDMIYASLVKGQKVSMKQKDKKLLFLKYPSLKELDWIQENIHII